MSLILIAITVAEAVAYELPSRLDARRQEAAHKQAERADSAGPLEPAAVQT